MVECALVEVYHGVRHWLLSNLALLNPRSLNSTSPGHKACRTEPENMIHARLCTYPSYLADLGLWKTPAWSARILFTSPVGFRQLRLLPYLVTAALRISRSSHHEIRCILSNYRLVCSGIHARFPGLLNYECKQLLSCTAAALSLRPSLEIFTVRECTTNSLWKPRVLCEKCAKRNQIRKIIQLRHAPKTMLRTGAPHIELAEPCVKRLETSAWLCCLLLFGETSLEVLEALKLQLMIKVLSFCLFLICDQQSFLWRIAHMPGW